MMFKDNLWKVKIRQNEGLLSGSPVHGADSSLVWWESARNQCWRMQAGCCSPHPSLLCWSLFSYPWMYVFTSAPILGRSENIRIEHPPLWKSPLSQIQNLGFIPEHIFVTTWAAFGTWADVDTLYQAGVLAETGGMFNLNGTIWLNFYQCKV